MAGPLAEPVGDTQIEGVFGDGIPAPSRFTASESLWAEWQRFGAFLRSPSLEPVGQSEAPLQLLLRIYLLDMLAMLALIIAASIAVAAGVYLPETAIAGIEFTPLVVLSVIIAAPLFEELGFRSWLSGRPAHIVAVALIVLGVVMFAGLHVVSPAGGAAAFILAIVGAIIALILLRKRPAFGFFERWFPGFFWLATISFALIHLANFSDGSLAVLLPLVLPQFILGSMLGYVRVRVGLWAAILLHAVHNATALSIAALAGGLS